MADRILSRQDKELQRSTEYPMLGGRSTLTADRVPATTAETLRRGNRVLATVAELLR